MHCTLKQLNEELKHKKPSEQVFFVPDSAEEIEDFCERKNCLLISLAKKGTGIYCCQVKSKPRYADAAV